MDDQGVSPLIGFILITFMVVMFLGAVQSTVPQRCEQVEAEHISHLESQISGLKDVPSTIHTHKICMGAEYPQYLFLMTPNTMSTSLTIEKINLSLEYDQILANGSRVEREMNITSTRVKLSPKYFYYPQESLVLENTALFKKTAGNDYINLSDQTIFRNEVDLELMEYPFLPQGPQNSQSKSFTGSENFYLTVEPISREGSMLVEDLRITFKSVNPGYWEDVPDYEVEVDGDTVSVKKGGITSLKYAYALIYGSSTGSEIDYSRYSSKNWDTSTQTKIVPKIDHPLVFSSNETEFLDVLLTVDGYGNPVEGLKIECNATLGDVVPRSKPTDSQGEADFLYAAPQVKHKDRKGTIIFSCPNCTTQKIITYEVKVLSGKPGMQYKLSAGIDGDQWH